MFTHKSTKVFFENRKQAIQLMGRGNYKRALRNNEFEFIDFKKMEDNQNDKLFNYNYD